MSNAISVRGLRKAYNGVEAVRGIDFEVAAGEVFGLLGPNGAGKTTTVEILEGYRHRDAGDVEVLGFDPGRMQTAVPRRIGVVLQIVGALAATRPSARYTASSPATTQRLGRSTR